MVENQKKIILVFALCLFVFQPSLGIINCINQDRQSADQRCLACYNSTVNRFGGCTPNWSHLGCLQFENLDQDKYTKCQKGYAPYSTRCYEVEWNIENCTEMIERRMSGSDGYYYIALCSSCSKGFPSKDLKSCLSWSRTPPQVQSYITNCLVGGRASESSTPKCSVCDEGYALDQDNFSCRKEL